MILLVLVVVVVVLMFVRCVRSIFIRFNYNNRFNGQQYHLILDLVFLSIGKFRRGIGNLFKVTYSTEYDRNLNGS